jgi:hypothetical protein
MDWMTLSITAIGALIFCLWVVIPIREYRMIYLRLRQRSHQSETVEIGERHT